MMTLRLSNVNLIFSLLDAYWNEKAKIYQRARPPRNGTNTSFQRYQVCDIQMLNDRYLQSLKEPPPVHCDNPSSMFVLSSLGSSSQSSQTFPTPDQEWTRHLISLGIPDWYIPGTPPILFPCLLHDFLLYSLRLTESSGPRLRKLN